MTNLKVNLSEFKIGDFVEGSYQYGCVSGRVTKIYNIGLSKDIIIEPGHNFGYVLYHLAMPNFQVERIIELLKKNANFTCRSQIQIRPKTDRFHNTELNFVLSSIKTD